jgi:hypothetical protein
VLWLVAFCLIPSDAAAVQSWLLQGRGHQGGYAQRCTAVTRLCEHYVEPECLKKEGPETCVNRLIDQLTTDGQQQQHAGASSTVLAVAIAVPLAAVGELALRMLRIYYSSWNWQTCC